MQCSVNNPLVDTLITNLIDHLPRCVHLIIGSRSEPLLPLSRWRLAGLLSEIRASDMRFDLIEARELLNLFLNMEVPPSVSEAITAHTEGWAAGLRLAALSFEGRSDFGVLSRDALGRNRYVTDYLMGEVFSRQTPALQELLLKSSILDWKSEPLIATLMGTGSSTLAVASLPQLVAAGLFVDVVNENEGTYRYHELFRDLLRQRLASQYTAQEIAALHREVSYWFNDRGLIEEAVRHALAAGDRLSAAQIVEESIHALLNHEDTLRLEYVLDMLPSPLVEERAPLLIARAWTLHFKNLPNAYPPLLQQAEALLTQPGTVPDEEKSAWLGDIATLRSQVLFLQSQYAGALGLAQQAVDAIPFAHDFARGLAFFYHTWSAHVSGNTAAAKRLILQILEQGTPDTAASNFRQFLILCFIQLDSLNVGELRTTSATMLRQANDRGFLLDQAWAHLLLGRASYEWNDLETAKFHFLTGAALRHRANAMCAHDCLTGLALTYLAQGFSQQANEVAATLLGVNSTPVSSQRLGYTQALRAHLALAQGDQANAERWLHSAELEPFLVPIPLLEVPIVTRVIILLASRTPENARQALQLAQQLQRDAKSIFSALRLVQSLALQALALDTLNDERHALSTLKQAIELAHPSGLLRTFVDLGPALGQLLLRLLNSGLVTQQGAADYVAQLLAAFPVAPSASPVRHPSAMNDDLIEPLTSREVQVLELLARRLTNREIAEILVISPFTVRRHIGNISDKFGVRGRRALVERARYLELIAPPSA